MPLAPRGEAASGSPTSTVLTVTSDPSVATATALPHAFDTSLGNNFTAASCPTFFNSFLDNSTFQACVPLSLLLQTSSAFFQATKSLLRITQVLDASCSADLPQCTALMDHYATELVKDAHCGADYRARNPIVMQAYDGFVAYVPSYQAGCLRDSSGSYCFANAITNSSSPTNSYPYYLPLGVPLPGGSRPTCNSCLQNTMNAYWTHASNSTQPISQTYSDSASQIAMQCGPDFINRTVAASTNGVTATLTQPGALSSAALLMTLFAFVF
ncbi:uncharacterized protein K452DRAFT_326585 [Aplosporella prunicola CBS 121167]|uniref:DUF7729 domain-containing protein n=1 Tax=Aplosporella prunicola CBS 121167 TaxID=1176127 RepID=A0A6A6BD25_9PEZI|nr:uncharacterized protein K452DRAFT_326585 [Aplosporella prunicola CBS 121167]KAF2142050.1 hypothetical protein K452DRAFT_326585 [Aplosporella prunicola CBS 121167]